MTNLLTLFLSSFLAVSTPTSSPIDAPIEIGFLMDTLNEERWHQDRTHFVEAGKEAGAHVTIAVADGNDALQVAQAEQMMHDGVDVLVIVPHNAAAMASIVHRAHANQIPVIAYDRLVKNADVDAYVSFDNEKIGALQAERMIEAVPAGNYMYIGGANTDHNSHLLKEGTMDVLTPFIQSGNILLIYDQWTTDWEPKYAEEGTKKALAINDGHIDAIIAANDATAKKAIDVLQSKGLAKKIPVIGQDADAAGIRAIRSGKQLATIYKPIDSLAKEAVTIALQMAKGEQIQATRYIDNGKTLILSILLTPIVVDKDNIGDVPK